MTHELVGIREAARRLGVSDTAVHKAIKAQRVSAPLDDDRDPNNRRPRLRWPQVEREWQANTDHSRRTHVGSQGSPRREAYTGGQPPEVKLPTAGEDSQGAEAEASVAGAAPSLSTSRAIREVYQARLAKLEYEQKIGKLIEADQVKARAFRMARSARDALLTMPDRLAPILASSTDVQEVHRLLLEDIERTCQRIAQDAAQAA